MPRHWLTFLLLATPAAAFAQQPPRGRTIAVDGVASVEREPERGVLTLAVETESGLAQAAGRANAEVMSRVAAELRRAGIAAAMMRTVSYRLDPQYARPAQRDSAPRITGYRALNMLEVTIDSIDRIGATIDAALAAGANRVAGLRYELRNPDEAQEAALAEAVARARRQAEVAAQAAGQNLGPPLEIQVQSSSVSPMPMAAAPRLAMQAEISTPVEGGTIRVTASVHIVFRLDRE
ncbi:MAG: SIMPL domain-containing protein [Gemmatimonadota bacterium]|jgi:uncharacterized protein YggE